MKSWTDRYWLIFLIAVAVGFAVPEAWALLDDNPATDPLTNWTIERGFAEVAVALGAFLVLHFSPSLKEGAMTRPAETLQATVSTLVGAVLILYGAFRGGFDFSSLQNPEVAGALTLVVGFVSSAITWYVARRQRDPADVLTSAPDGTVQG